MKVLVQFDAFAGDYEIKGEMGSMSRIDGVTSLALLRKVSGDAPRFCIELDVAEDKVSTVTETLERYKNQYPGQVSNVSVLSYTTV